MKAYIKNNFKYLLFLLFFGLVGGYFTARYSLEMVPQDAIDEAVAQVGSIEMVILITTIQCLLYALGAGIVGKILAEKIGLWRKTTFEAKPVYSTIIVSVLAGVGIILPDIFIFGRFSDAIKESYNAKPSADFIFASLTYGGVVEEILMRLFLMSLIAFILCKITHKAEPSETQLVVANVIVAILFAAGHLPATAISIGLSPMIIFRCFLLNGGAGLLFGRLYRKYGIHYAMLTHAGAHIVSKLIWILFI